MAALQDILYTVELLEVAGDTRKEISDIHLDSRQVGEGGLFAAFPGTQVDGHHFIEDAIARGAKAIVCETMPENRVAGITYLRVADAAVAIGVIAANFFDHPSAKMKVVAVTGTNGKSSVVTMLYRLFSRLGYKVGMLSTIENRIHQKRIAATHTTPDSIAIQRIMHTMAEAGCGFVFMEASSHAIHQKRLAGLQLTGAVFTNITHDHLDYHKTFDNYLKAKKALFDGLPASAWALVNIDDKHGHIMVQNTSANVNSYALKAPADFKGRVLDNALTGLVMQIGGTEVHTQLIGHFNAYNALAVYGVARLLDVGEVEALRVLSNIKAAEGRFEIVSSKQGTIGIVDYAHTPDALEKVLETIQEVRTGNETVITVVGCGGDRDRKKRPAMAAIATRLSDKVILTADNPRTEDPAAIIEEMKAGLLPPYIQKVLTITHREEAIRTAVALTQPGDIVLVAGKGHEKYQEINGKRLPFDDKAILQSALNQNLS